jgi:hypothetical protein
MDVIDRYIEEMNQDTMFDDFSLKDTQMKLPSIKHKWVGRLIRHKDTISKLTAKKKSLISNISKKLVDEGDYKISQPMAEKACEKHETVINISKQIKGEYLIVEFLEKCEKVLNSMTFDIKNLVEIMKMETL